MNDIVIDFKEFLCSSKNASDNTVEAYLRDINNFNAFCASNKKDLFLANSTLFKKYLDVLRIEGKSESSIQRIISSIRCLYKFLLMKEYVDADPTSFAKTSRNVKKVPGILETDEVLLLLAQPNGNDLKSRRDKTILEMMYATGIKVSEVISIKINDVNPTIGLLNICSAKGRERVVPIYSQAIKNLNDYINNVRPYITGDEVEELFTNMNGKPMSRQGLWKIIKYYSDKADIDKDITPQTLRHSFATHLLENGAEIKDIKEMLGHNDVSSTQMYTQIIKNKYTKNYQKFHPLAKKG